MSINPEIWEEFDKEAKKFTINLEKLLSIIYKDKIEDNHKNFLRICNKKLIKKERIDISMYIADIYFDDSIEFIRYKIASYPIFLDDYVQLITKGSYHQMEEAFYFRKDTIKKIVFNEEK